jgi:hypothetical protein
MLPVCVWGSPRYLGTHVTALPSQFVYCPIPTYTAAIPNTTAGLRFRLAAEQVHTKSLRSDTVCVCVCVWRMAKWQSDCPRWHKASEWWSNDVRNSRITRIKSVSLVVLSASVVHCHRINRPAWRHTRTIATSALLTAHLASCGLSWQQTTMTPVGWGTALQFGRSRVRFPTVSLEFFMYLILSVALWPWGRLCL